MLSFALTLLRLFKAIWRSWQAPLFRATAVLAVLILVSGTVFYHSVEGWSWIDSLYFSATMVSTAGIGDLAPQTDFGKLFTVVYIFVGVGVFVVLFAQLASALLRTEAEERDASKNQEKGN
jgi:voltage-gated potassium channel